MSNVSDRHRHVVRISRYEEDAFMMVIDKLVKLSDDRRRRTCCWKAMKKFLELTGNWKAAPRGKPGIPARWPACLGDECEGVHADSQKEFP